MNVKFYKRQKTHLYFLTGTLESIVQYALRIYGCCFFNINVFLDQGRVVCNFPYNLIEVTNLSPIVEERRKEHKQIKFLKLISVHILNCLVVYTNMLNTNL